MYNIFVSTTVKTFSSLQVVFNRPSRNIYLKPGFARFIPCDIVYTFYLLILVLF